MIHFIVNPTAKSGRGKKVWAQVERAMQEHPDVVYEVHKTEQPLDAIGIVKRICAEELEPFTVVPVGGDGTLNEVICGLDLRREDILLGYIPTGSGNDFCRSLRMKRNPLEALERILKAEEIRTVDVGEVTCTYDTLADAIAGGAYEKDGMLTSEKASEEDADSLWCRTRRFGVSTGCGYDAEICHRLLTSKTKMVMNRMHLGKLCYIAVGLVLLCEGKHFSMYSQYWKRYRKAWKDIAFCSVHIQPYEGGGFHFAPGAVNDDGRLDVCFAGASDAWHLLGVLAASLISCHVHLESVTSVRTKSIGLQLPEGICAHVDGESLGCPRTMAVSCIPGALRVIV